MAKKEPIKTAVGGRDTTGRFAPGNTLGVGRPKKEMCISDALREILAGQEVSVSFTANGQTKTMTVTSDKNIGYGISAIIIGEAMKGNVQAFREICDRVQGKPMMPIGDKGNVIQLVVPERFLPELPDE